MDVGRPTFTSSHSPIALNVPKHQGGHEVSTSRLCRCKTRLGLGRGGGLRQEHLEHETVPKDLHPPYRFQSNLEF